MEGVRMATEAAKALVDLYRLGGPDAVAEIVRGPAVVLQGLREIVALLPIPGHCGGLCPKNGP
jgi:hypothetical protein